MKRIFITKVDVDYAVTSVTDVDNIAALVAGSLVAFAQDGTYISDSFATSPGELFKNFYIVLGTADGPIVSPMIDYKTFKYSYKAYVAPILPVKVIGTESSGNGALNFPSSLTSYIGKSAEIMLIDQRYPPHDKRREKYYDVPITAVSTNTTILNALIAKINADPNRICTASAAGSTTGIILTALYGDFEWVNMGGVFESTTEATNGGSFTAHVMGEGTYAQILQTEKDYSPDQGNLNSIVLTQELYHPTSNIVAGTTYDQFILNWTAQKSADYQDSANRQQELIIAIPVGEDGAKEIGKVLADFFATVNVALDAIE